ncbi:Tropinesterase [Candidatus Entotheonellaceae bacterium PAL068K]
MSKPGKTDAPQTLTYMTDTGLRLVGDAWGAPDAPPVILLHGGGQTRHAWGGTARILAAHGWYAVALDLRGHGDSAWAADGNYHIDAHVADLRSILTHFEQRPVLVGASLGGMMALLTAGEASQPVSSAVILVDITPRVDPKGVERIQAFMRARPEGFATIEEAADTVAAYLPHRPKPNDVSGLAKNLRPGPNGRYQWHWDPQLIASGSRPRDPERMLAAARNLRVPTLLVRGNLSDVVSDETQAEFLAAVPHAQQVDVAGAGHMVAGDKNDAFGKTVIAFLADLSASSATAPEAVSPI